MGAFNNVGKRFYLLNFPGSDLTIFLKSLKCFQSILCNISSTLFIWITFNEINGIKWTEKISKDVEFQDKIKKLDLINIFRNLHTIAKFTLFWRTHGTVINIDCMLSQINSQPFLKNWNVIMKLSCKWITNI